MEIKKIIINFSELPRYRIVRGMGKVVSVDVHKARAAMKYAMENRRDRRSLVQTPTLD